MNARKIYDEPNVLSGVLENRLFLGILGSEFVLQARLTLPPCSYTYCVLVWRHTLRHTSLAPWQQSCLSGTNICNSYSSIG